jgi:hypothetical protein
MSNGEPRDLVEGRAVHIADIRAMLEGGDHERRPVPARQNCQRF